MSSTPQKIPLVDPATATDQQRNLIEAGRAGRPYVPKVYATLANHPSMAGPWMRFAAAVLYEGTLPGRDRETLILRAAHNCQGHYEWGQHVGWGRREGLTDAEIAGIAEGPASGALDPWAQLLVTAADELFSSARLSDTTWAALAERYGTEQLIEVCFTVGQYTMLAYALNSIGVTPEDGAPALGQP
ncbi:MAG: carboxymuconolactone decarboxylase family protein [Acidimicrobiia bacterium]